MNPDAPEQKLRDYLRKVTGELRQTRRLLLDAEAARNEPIAVVGMGCRYPGGIRGPADLWRVVRDEVDAISAFPTDRGWDPDLYDPDPERPGHSYARTGGFLPDADRFDAAFFGISPREALAMDPQQRLALEVSWETFEHAGVDPRSLRGGDTGVYIGTNDQDYAVLAAAGPDDVDGYVGTGNLPAVISGRVAYTLGLHGPAVTVGTACSSSLVALHLAVRALRGTECSLALAGGVDVMATPTVFVEFSRQRGLAPDGRCKSFAAAADGTGFAEGCGLLLLERLSDAERNGHVVHAVIRGSAVNSDGGSNGLTAPSGPAQRRVIQQALADARLAATDVDLVEAHGTGTTLGDPIEAQAILATYGSGRAADRPVRLGSIKSNIGHAQAAAGVAGIIKMTESMRHGVMPRTLHVDAPTPHVDWSAGAVSLLSEACPWPELDRPRRAAVSSFGISGTNAHVVLEAPGGGPADEDPRDADCGEPAGEGGASPSTWLLSARSGTALREQAVRLHERVAADPRLRPADVAWTLATTRARFEHRAALVATGRDELLASLAALGRDDPAPALLRGRAGSSRAGAVAVLFSGQGSQRIGAGRELYQAEPVFAAAFDEACAQLDPLLDRPLREVAWAAPGTAAAAQLDQTGWTQPALFALQVALFRLLEHAGLPVARLAGHSIGEISAAHVAGLLSLPDAARLVAARGRLMQAATPGGVMVAVQATEAEVRASLAGLPGLDGGADGNSEPAGPQPGTGFPGLDVAAVNGPLSVVVSGDSGAAARFADHWAARGRKTRRLAVSHAFHSHHLDEVLDEFRAVAAGLSYLEPTIPLVSTLTGRPAAAAELASADYWVRQIRETVRFADAVESLRGLGVTSFVELGPDPVLGAAVHEVLDNPAGPRHPVPSPAQAAAGGGAPVADTARAFTLLRAGQPEPITVSTALAELDARGVPVDWARVLGHRGARAVELPTYPFERQRFWARRRPATADLTAVGFDQVRHPFLLAAVDLAGASGEPAGAGGAERVLTGRLAATDQPWLLDHEVHGTLLLSPSALVELALEAGARAGCGQVHDLVVDAPLTLSARTAHQVQVVVRAADDAGLLGFEVWGRAEVDADGPGSDSGGSGQPGWRRHAHGLLAPAGTPTDAEPPAILAAPPASSPPGAQWPPGGAQEIDVADVYERLAAVGHRYGPAYQVLRAAWRAGGDICAELSLGTVPEGADGHGEGAVGSGTRGEGSAPAGDRPPEFAVHPTLIDAASQAAFLDPRFLASVVERGETAGEAGRHPWLATRWRAVSVHATGATDVRVRLSRSGPDTVRLTMTDPAGGLVLTAESVGLEPLPPERVPPPPAPRADGLYRLGWAPAGLPAPRSSRTRWVVLGDGAPASLIGALASGEPVPEVVFLPVAGSGTAGPAQVRATVGRVLGQLQGWLAEPALAGSRLVVVTRGAVAVDGADPVSPAGREGAAAGLDAGGSVDPAGGASWGLVRSAQSEHPDRFLLLDVDQPTFGSLASVAVASTGAIDSVDGSVAAGLADLADWVGALVSAAEPQAAVRDGRLRLPRLAPLPAAPENARSGIDPGLDPAGTVLVTGGTGGLGSLLARHLVTTHDIRHLLLTSRRGPESPGASELVAELTDLGAQVNIVACDHTDPTQVAALLADVPDAHPLRAVFHTAGTLHDATLTSLTPAHLDDVLPAKIDAAWHLHHQTRHLPLTHFVLYSSLAGTLGAPGQANYAAANTYLDTLAHHRHLLGLPATTLAWGLWQHTSGMTQNLTSAQHTRIDTSGVRPLTTEQGHALLDAALAGDEPTLVAAHFNLATLRLHAASSPPVLRVLTGAVPLRRAAASGGAGGTGASAWADRLADRPVGERETAALDLVQSLTAQVLGHRSASAVDPDQAFSEMGFDSLGAVRLRNDLSAATGLRLAATAVFDYPNPRALAGQILAELAPRTPAPPPGSIVADLDRLATALTSLAPGDEQRVRATASLRELVATLGDTGSAPERDVLARIGASSGEEIFAFIDNELAGSSSAGGQHDNHAATVPGERS
ncbi:KR domain protein [Pseudofrankia inefficax]|uniref:KR domain protein n=1 Tax=Pseudofrankia inefficax (strain DSM 45817 / CECT 9037 / DDB 130130 / EuI1c) TaxID=298654 RepID=E3JBT5_PSEI1|nr:type I polyketide synthase [Pseudofrankia inefficax]ADP82245.1 KR domain protein [Pseudofrankia inefficax]